MTWAGSKAQDFAEAKLRTGLRRGVLGMVCGFPRYCGHLRTGGRHLTPVHRLRQVRVSHAACRGAGLQSPGEERGQACFGMGRIRRRGAALDRGQGCILLGGGGEWGAEWSPMDHPQQSRNLRATAFNVSCETPNL